MAHAAQQDFFTRVAQRFPAAFHNVRVLDCGSLDVNGSLRPLFSRRSRYTGIDLREGRNVTLVGFVHRVEHHLRQAHTVPFDTVVSAEMLEHDEHWRKSLRAMYALLRPGGLLALSCAAPGRAEHGTRSVPDREDGFDGIWGTSPDYYRPLSMEDLRSVFDLPTAFTDYELMIEEDHHDLYFWGLKPL